jgi:hypothetical protein
LPKVALDDVLLALPVVTRLLPGAAEVVQVNDVVAAEHRLGAVPRPQHDGMRVDAGVDVVLDA